MDELGPVVDGLPGLLWSALPDGRVEFLSQQWAEYTGLDLRQPLGPDWQAAIHPEDLPLWLDRWRSLATSREPWELELRFRRFDGTYRWFLCRGSPQTDAFGQIIRWCGINTDIDEAKRAEDAVRGSEQNLALMINTIPALAWSTNADGSAEFFNQHYLDYVGLTADQAKGWGWTAAVHSDDLNGLAGTWQGIMASEASGEAEARLRRHDGAYRWFLFRANPLRDESGTVVKWYGVNTDIEDRKRAADALRRSEAFLLQIQAVSHTGGWRYDVATDTVESSPEIQRVYAIQPGEDYTRPPFWFDRIHPEDRPRVQAHFERCLTEKIDYQAGYRIVLPDGSVRYQYATGHPILDDAGNLVEFIGASMDMTDHWRATNELHRASEALRELQATMARAAQVTTVGELAASIAHEVNQPLSAILTNAGTGERMLSADPPNVGGAREIVRRIVRDGNRAVDVIARLRALFSKKPFTLQSMDLNDATREVIALSSSDLQRSRVALRSELADDLPPVIGDRIQLQQVIHNLLRNALDAMVEVHDRPRQLLVRTEREGPWARVTVRDAGMGLDRQAMEKLFDAFYTTKSAGMGIGLSVSRSIVERHHGRLWAEPNDGPGATFAFRIPCETREAAAGEPASAIMATPATSAPTNTKA